MSGRLFTDYFLTDGIKVTEEWKSSVEESAAFAAFRDGVSERYEAVCSSGDPNEAVTEQELIRPVLELLGWDNYLPQQGTARNEDIPDHLLFADADSKQRATGELNADDRFRSATAVQESKRFGLPLDNRDKDDKVQVGTPHGQIRRYLSTADNASEGRIRWGILTNGRVWRLYDHRARPRATGYIEVDLEDLLRPEREREMRIFQLLFRRDSFVRQEGATATFLELALAEGSHYEDKVAQDLSGVVFDRVFPNLIEALADRSDESLPDCRNAALVFLYRMLFVLYAEDRGLLPVSDSRYDDYGLRKHVREDIAVRMADGDAFSAIVTNYYDHILNLFKVIDKGDPSIGLPAYNGGLFAAEAAPMLDRVRLSDDEIAPIVYDLSHTREPKEKQRFVNYRDMSVQQLGSIYERLLEREPKRDEGGKIAIRPNPYARKDSGSFYTPQELVDLIVERTLKPLVEERLTSFKEKSRELKRDRRPRSVRRAELEQLDPAEAVLNFKVLDPAMGSGHFLVTAVDFLSDYIAEQIENVPAVPDWLDEEYTSPLVERVQTIRNEIIHRSRESNWVLDVDGLTDEAIIRRMVLKRCIYGVDKNPLTVELAKVSLWLHSFTVGAPLSFLDHHLRCGDSLVGMRVSEGVQDLEGLGGGLFASSAIAGAEAATTAMGRIEKISDSDVSEVRQSSMLFDEVENTTADLRGLLDFICAMRWTTAGMKKKVQDEFETPLIMTLAIHQKRAYKVLARGPNQLNEASTESEANTFKRYRDLWKDTRQIADRERFLHWEVAFPGVWRNWQENRPQGGFDAVIGNPPWDQIEQKEVEWFSTRDDTIAHAPTGAARKKLIDIKRQVGDKLARDYENVRARDESMRFFARSFDEYPLLSGGRINLYSLFVERAMSLVKPNGFVGLLTPSGIYADKNAARFFKLVSTGGRLAGLFDFENRKIFFKDIHASFKFCVLVFGGEERFFGQSECAFFLRDTQMINNGDRCFPLTPTDFARVNPNTGTAPVFRHRRDAEITREIYERNPVLVNRSQGDDSRALPVRFMQGLFNMTSDSILFETGQQLKLRGFYPIEGNRWKKGSELYLPLYEGKMVQAFDHRAASVVVNPNNLNRPAQPRAAKPEEQACREWLPNPHFWVSDNEIGSKWLGNLSWTVAFKHVTAATNIRTMIALIAPRVGFGNSLPVLWPNNQDRDGIQDYKYNSCITVANLNTFAFDFVTRQKVQGQNLNWFIVEQLPVIALSEYDRNFGTKSARDLVRDHVLRLSYTAHDLAPFANDLGYDGQPFVWDEEERQHLRARLDALYFHLYGLSRDDAGYILDTFPIVRRDDEKAFGRYRTKEMILAYMNALAAGDTETVVDV